MPSPSILEIVIIAVIAIVFVKPEDWPALLRKIGKWYGKIQRQIWDFKMASRQMMDEYSLKEELKHDHFESQYGQDIPEEENHENSYKHGQSVSRSGYVDTENLDDEDEYSDEGETPEASS